MYWYKFMQNEMGMKECAADLGFNIAGYIDLP